LPPQPLAIETILPFGVVSEGKLMQNSLTLPAPEQQLLDLIGGDSLDGSGFEAEVPDSAFVSKDNPKLLGGEV
jgi:hypothetical protein